MPPWSTPSDLTAAEGALVVGRDMRVSSPEMSAAFIDGVLSRGADVVDIGLASTDELWFASGRLGLPGAMFTASHNPAEYNGIKFCLAGARPIAPAQLVEIADRALAGEPVPAAARGERSETDLLPAYADHLHSLVDLTGIRRLTVVVDAGNGMAGHTLPAVLGPVDLELIGLFTDPDGTFPNHPPNPLEPENLVDAQAAVIEHGADLALVFDGDADRCFIIDERGEVVSPSAVTAMIASQELAREPGGDDRVQQDHLLDGAGGGRRGRRPDRDHQGRAHLRQGGDGRARRDLRRRALGPLLLPRLLGRRHRDAGRAARAGAGGTHRPAVVRPGRSSSTATRRRGRSTPRSPTSSRSWTRWRRRSPAAASRTGSTG